ncbi:MAG TPA: invasin domain 3-containing protein [Gaiellaceae bacterium]|nr:invasin domain 3-containing protein [Gaiellaceae bacterium]
MTAATPQTAGSAFGVTVTAKDAYGNTATGYTGTVHFTTSDGQGAVPADYTFVAGDNGSHTFAGAVTLKTAGAQTITAADTGNGSITGTSAAITVNPGAAVRLVVSTSAGATRTAGSPFDVTVTARDAFGNTATGYTGTVRFGSGDGQAALPADYTFVAGDHGSHTFTNGASLKTAGSQTISATDTASSSITGTSGPVDVVPAAAASLTVTTDAANPQTAGAAFDVIVAARDAYGNVATGYGGTVHLGSSDPGATLPADSTLTNGTRTFTGAAFATAGAQTITATDTVSPSISGTSPTVNVGAAAAANLTVTTTAGASRTAGSPFSATVTAYDRYGNVAAGYTGTVHLTSNDAQASLPSDYTFVAGDGGTHTFAGVVYKTAGSRSLTATDTGNGSITGTSGSTVVTAAAASTLAVTTTAASPQTAGGTFQTTVTAFDAYGNVATGYAGTVHFGSTDARAVLPANYTFGGADNGTHTFSGVAYDTAGSQRITATDTATPSVMGTSAATTVAPAAAASLTVTTTAGSPQTAGGTFQAAVTAFDAYGNVATGYGGTVHFTSGDPQAVLPADATLTNGTRTFSGVAFDTAGSQTLTATDTTAPSITGTSTAVTVAPAQAASLVVTTTAASPQTAGATFQATVTAKDAFGNVATGYGGTVHFTSGDPQAVLPADATLTNGTRTFPGVAFGTAGSQTVTAADTTAPSITGTSAPVTVAAAALDHFSFALAGPQASGRPFTGVDTLTADDRYGNVVTSFDAFADHVTISANAPLTGSVSGLSGVNRLVSAGDFVNGVANLGALGMTYTGNAATGSFTATAATGQTGTSAPVTVGAGTATRLVVTGSASQTAGASQALTISAEDASGNVVTGYGGDKSLTFSGASAIGSHNPTVTDKSGAAVPFGTATTVTFTNGVATAGGSLRLYRVESATISVTDGALSSAGADRLGVSVAPATAASLQLSPSTTTPTAGSPDTLTLTALDPFGNTDTSYAGDKSLTFGGASSLGANAPTVTDMSATAQPFGTPETISFANGVATATMKLYKAETASVTVGDGTISNGAGTSFTTSAAAATQLALSVDGGSSPTANVAFPVAVTSLDQYGNVSGVASDTGVALSLATGTGTLGGTLTTTVARGRSQATFGGVTYTKAESGVKLTATRTSGDALSPVTSSPFTVGAVATRLVVTSVAGGAHPQAGQPFSITVGAEDASSNTSSVSSATSFAISLHTGTGTLAGTATGTIPAGADHVSVSGLTYTKAEGGVSVTVTVTSGDSLSAGTSAPFTVDAGPATHLVLAGPGSATAGTPFGLTVTAYDALGNVATGYTGGVHFTSSDAGAQLPADYTFAPADAGTHTFTNVALENAGSQTVTATDTVLPSITGTSGTIAVHAGAAASLALTTTAASPQAAGAAFSATVTARDAYGNVATGYTGTVHFTSSDPQHTLPADSTLTNGTGTFGGVVLGTTGTQTLTVADTSDGALTGAANVTVGPGAPNAGRSSVSASPATIPADGTTPSTITVHVRDAYGNAVTTGGAAVTLSTDHGTVSSAVDAGNGTYTGTFTTTTTQTAHVGGTINGSAIGTSATVASTPGAADGSQTQITPQYGAILADGSDHMNVTVQLRDRYGNDLTAGGQSVSLSSTLGATFGAVTDNGNGTYTAVLTAGTTSGTAQLTATVNGRAVSTTVSFQPVPVVIVVDGGTPANPTASRSVNVAFHASDSSATTQCALDGAAFAPCTSPFSASGLTEGTHTLRLRGTNGAGTGPESDLTWRIDLTGPTVSFTTAPGRYTNNPTEPLAASASDPSGVASVDFRYVPHGTPCSAAGGTDIFFDASAPYSTTWTVPADGTYDLCAVAADNLGNTSVATTTVVADQTAPTGTFPAVGTLVGSTRYIGGDVPLHVTASDATSGVAQVALAYAGTSSGTIGTVASAPYDATWHAGGLADGPYTLHATIGDKASNSATLTQDVVVDNTAPTASLDDPGAYGHGTIHLSVTASDTGSGVDTAAIQIQSSPHGAGTWTTIGTGVAVAWTPTPDGAYDLRALVPDNVGNQTTTATRTIVVDNTPPTVFDDSDSSWHRTPVTLHVTAADAQSGIASVTYELDGGSTQTGTTVAVPATDGVHTITYHATNGAGLTTSGTATVKFDATPPSQVTLDAPANGALLRGTVTLSASATDATSGIASTTFHVARAGTLGANDCATFGQTITSPLDTTTLADGQYDLWVAAADQAGNGRCSVTSGPGSISVTIDNTAPVTTDDAPAGPQNHDVLVHLAATDNLTGVASTEYSLDGGPWTPGTTVSVLAPADHSDDGSHTIQYRSTDGAGNVETVKTTHVVIDTTAPAGGVDDPGSYLSGTVDLTASPTDSDVASVAFLYRPAGGSGPWTSIGTDTSAPYDVPWITTAVPDGRYDLEEVVTDTAGNSNTVPMSTKTVDNTAPDTAAVTAPAAGADTGGTVAFAASASDATSGVKTVTFEVEATGQSGFTTVDADTNGAPYTGTWNSTGVPDGPAQVRVVVTDFAGNSTTSAPVSFIVDNTAPTVSLQAPPAAAASASLSATGSADIDHVDYEWSGDGTTWHSIGTSSSPPYSTTWTTPAADGTYQVRARATDHGGNVSPYDVKTVVVDHTAPTASALLPADGDTVGGSSVPLSVTASDGGSGVASVTFLYRPSGGGAWTGIAAPAGAPYTGTWDVHSLPSGDYDVEAVVLDGAGNATTIVHTVHVDSTPPTLSAFPVGSPVHGTITLQVTTSADTAGATYGVAPSGGGAWTQVASSSTGPTFSAPFDTTTLADGTYDFRATVADRFRNATTLDVPVVVDNTPPSVVASTPADGSVVPSAGSLSLTASEPVASVDDLQLDGANARFTPSISGADVTFPTGALPPGNHALTGWLHDAAGNSAPFRINVTVRDTSAAALPPVAKNVSSSADTVLTSADGTASVTTHHDVWQQAIPQPQDFLVLHIDPMPASLISPGAGAQIAGPVEDVRMTWDLAGTEEHHFDDPIEIDLADPTGSGTPATAEVTTSWRAIPQLQTAGTLPAGQQDGYWRTGSTVHILTRHLSLFTILTTLTSSAVAPPIEFSGTVGFDGLTLRWAPGIPTVQSFALYADGAVVGRFGGTTYEAKLGQITSDDTRTFTITETSTAGAESAPSQALRVVPAVAGDSQAQAAAALAGRGFTVGNLVPVAAVGEPAGTVVGPTDVQVLPVGSPVDLQVASGGAAHSPFAFTVAAAPRLRAVAGTLYARVAVTASARIDVTLDANPWNRLQRWHFFHVAPGATIVKLRLRAPLQPGDYRLFWKATSLSDHSVSRRITPLRILAKKARAHGTPNQVLVLAGARSLASARPANARLSRVTPEQAYLFATYHDVSVVVVDTALYGAQLARNLHTVFPNTAVVALARSPYTRTSLARGGCVAVPASTTTKQLVALIDRLDSKP